MPEFSMEACAKALHGANYSFFAAVFLFASFAFLAMMLLYAYDGRGDSFKQSLVSFLLCFVGYAFSSLIGVI